MPQVYKHLYLTKSKLFSAQYQQQQQQQTQNTHMHPFMSTYSQNCNMAQQ